ncbi:uncharacterized protein N7503_002624 [Penicillium pulvis]|uniref:uncharacterized protein n=1 Tax=Penicillium pulvis TaxID=1562058 RepID=UPI002546A10E|nr:uncharacterized protein N7503_002624 [Penicillium pulvis]KAJ5810406.1 hypothetical protein N7503_002624 [Penicillium pulvis]
MSDSKVSAKVPEDKAKNVYYSRKWIQESIQSFGNVDTNKDGFLSKAEIKKALNEEYPDANSGKGITDSNIDEIFKIFDYNDDKKLNIGEFIEFDMFMDATLFNYYHAVLF